MKVKNSLFFVSFFAIVAFFIVGCAGPRTGNVGFRNTPPIQRTNTVGTVITQKVGDQPEVVYRQENYTITSTPPTQERTWKETVFGQRPPADTQLIPPFPNAGISGVSPTTVTVPRGTLRNNRVAPNSTSGRSRTLQPSRTGWSGGTGVSGTFATFGGGIRSFLLPTIYGGNGTSRASLTATAGVRGRVNVPLTRFERSALGHAASIDPNFRRGGYGAGGNGFTANIAVAGGAQFRSGLRGGY